MMGRFWLDSCILVFLPLCNPLPLSVGWAWWLAPNQENTAKVMEAIPMIRLSKIVTCLAGILTLVLRICLPCWRGPCVKGPWVTFSQQQKTESYQRSHELWSVPIPAKPSDETRASADAWISTLWETLRQRTQVSGSWIPDLHKLWDYKCCFKVTKFGDNSLMQH